MLLSAGRNVAISHELFKRMKLTPSLYETIHAYGYTLIIDEVVEIIEPINLSEYDTNNLIDNGWIVCDEYGNVTWTFHQYHGKFDYIKRMAESKTLIYFNGQLFLWLFPIEILKSFSEIYILTFLFEGSHLYNLLRIHGIEYKVYHMENNQLVEGQADLSADKAKIKGLLEIYDGTLNVIGDTKGSLSSTWYKKPHNRERKIQLMNNACNYLRHKQHARTKDTMYSTFADVNSRYPVGDYASSFVPCNARATNEYGNRHNLAYLLNVYENPFIIQWFKQNGVTVNQDQYALSQLLQWVWRSAIRNDEKVYLYLPSKRMRNLLNEWLEN